MRWGEDIFLPLGVVVAGLVVVLGPASVCCLFNLSIPSEIATGGTLALAGTLLFPAVVLTLATSGSSFNLRPDRIMESIRICGARYLLPLIAWVLALPLYLMGIFGISSSVVALVGGTIKSGGLSKVAGLTFLPLVLGVYLMHYFCWEIGLLYRLHHEQFPWLFQRHIKRDPMPVRTALVSPGRLAQPKSNR